MMKAWKDRAMELWWTSETVTLAGTFGLLARAEKGGRGEIGEEELHATGSNQTTLHVLPTKQHCSHICTFL